MAQPSDQKMKRTQLCAVACGVTSLDSCFNQIPAGSILSVQGCSSERTFLFFRRRQKAMTSA